MIIKIMVRVTGTKKLRVSSLQDQKSCKTVSDFRGTSYYIFRPTCNVWLMAFAILFKILSAYCEEALSRWNELYYEDWNLVGILTNFFLCFQGFAFNFHGDPRSLDFPLSQLASTMFASFDGVWPHQSLWRGAPGTRRRPNRDRGQVKIRDNSLRP